MNGAQSLFKALVDAGVSTCFANPGTSEMQLVYEIGLTDQVRPVLCLHENVATGAADGYGRMTGKPAFTLLHVGSGFANGMAMLHSAGRAHTPLINVVGANATYHQLHYPEHELIGGHVTDLARIVSHWSQEARSASHLGELGAEAAMLAQAGRVCTIVAPTDCHWETARPPPPPRPALPRPETAPAAIAEAADLLGNGRRTGLVIGNLALHGPALETAGRIAAHCGATLLTETFPSSHLARGEGRPLAIEMPYALEMAITFLAPFEQLIFVGALFPVTTFAYRDKPVVKSPPGCTLFALASPEQDLPRTLAALAVATGATAPAPCQPRLATAAPSGALSGASIGQSLAALLPDDAILVDEALSNSPPLFAATKGARRHDYINTLTGGAIGGGLPMALGAAIACPGRQVIALQADGSAMYTVAAQWSMAREQVDVVAIILKNDAYATLGLEMARVREGALNPRMHAMLELGQPSLDWVSIATGMGVPARRVTTAEGFHAELAAALAAPGPHLIECPVDPPEGWQALEERIYRER